MTEYEAQLEHERIVARIRSITDQRRRESETRLSAPRRSELRDLMPDRTLWAKNFDARERSLFGPVEKIAAGLKERR